MFIFSSADVKQSVKSLLPTFIPTNAKPRQDEANTGSQPPRLLDFCSIDDEGVETDAIDVDMELQTFFDQPRLDVEPVKYWAQRKTTPLSKLALQLLSIPRSSAPVERLFSKAGIVLSQRRSRIGSSKLEKLIFLK